MHLARRRTAEESWAWDLRKPERWSVFHVVALRTRCVKAAVWLVGLSWVAAGWGAVLVPGDSPPFRRDQRRSGWQHGPRGTRNLRGIHPGFGLEEKPLRQVHRWRWANRNHRRWSEPAPSRRKRREWKSSKCVIDGFTFMAGKGLGNVSSPVTVANAKTEFLNCVFTNNYSPVKAGAVLVYGASANPSFVNCTFVSNRSDRVAGGALREWQSRAGNIQSLQILNEHLPFRLA